jgi:hypothetical protein
LQLHIQFTVRRDLCLMPLLENGMFPSRFSHTVLYSLILVVSCSFCSLSCFFFARTNSFLLLCFYSISIWLLLVKLRQDRICRWTIMKCHHLRSSSSTCLTANSYHSAYCSSCVTCRVCKRGTLRVQRACLPVKIQFNFCGLTNWFFLGCQNPCRECHVISSMGCGTQR